MTRVYLLLLAILLLSPAALARDEDTGVEPGLNIDFSGGKSLNKVGSALSYTYPFGGGFTFRLTLDQNVQNEPQANRLSDSRKLRFDLFYEPVPDARISTYYEQNEYNSDMATQDQYQISKSHRAGTTANVKLSDAFTADLNAYFTLNNTKEGTFDYDLEYREYFYDSLSANTDMHFDYQITDKTRLSLDLTGSREVREYPTQPALNSEYYVGSMTSSLTGNYALWKNTKLEVRYLFGGTLYRDLDLVERNQDTFNNSFSLVANYATPFDVTAILSADFTHGMTSYLEKEVYLQKYYYWIYPELDPIPDYRIHTPWWPLYDVLTRGLNWKLQLNWDSPRKEEEEFLHWTLSQDTSNRRYYDDDGALPPERFAIADSVLTNIKNTMSTDAQINLGRSFILKLQHKVTHDDYNYHISAVKDMVSLYNDVSSNIKWKLTPAVSFNANFNIGFDRTVGGISTSLPRRNEIKLGFGSEVKLLEGLRVGLTYTLSRNNGRTYDFQSGSDSLSRELVVEPVFSVSDYWGLDFSGSFKETVTFPVGESTESNWLKHDWKMSSKLNIYPTSTLTFELTYKLNSTISYFSYYTEQEHTDHTWGLSFSYNIIEDLIIHVNTDYRIYEYAPDRNSFNVGLMIRSNF